MGGGIRLALAPVFWMGRLSGVFPLDDKLQLSPLWTVPSVCLVLLVSTSAVLFQQDIHWLGSLARVVFAGISWSLSLTTIILVFLSFPQRRLYQKVIHEISNLEDRLSCLGIKGKHSHQLILADIGVRTIFLFATNIFSFNKMDSRLEMFWAKVITFYFTQWCISCVEMHIVALSSYLADLFKSLSESLPSRHIDRYLEESTALVEISRSINKLFTRQAFLISSALFLCTTLDLYFYIIVIRNHSSMVFSHHSTYFRCLTRTYEIWRSGFLLRFYLTVWACQYGQIGFTQLLCERYSLNMSKLHVWNVPPILAKRLDAKLYSTALEDTTNEIAENEKLMLYFSMKQEVKFIACGFFPVDFTLIFSIMAAVTNYLVILAQFGTEKTNSTTTSNPHNSSINQETPG